MGHNINQWITDTINDSPNTWLHLLFRADGTILNGHNLRQSVWSQGSIPTIDKVHKALSWTITECRRKYDRKMKFAAFLGGEPKLAVFPHIHAFVELPTHTTQEILTDYLDHLWYLKLKKSFKHPVISSVTSQVIIDGKSCTSYCSRFEGVTFSFGDDKVIVNNSFYM